MLRERWTYILAALVVVGLAANGCSNNPSTPNDTSLIENEDLNGATGGFNTQGAQPGFGDLALAGSGSSEAAAADPLETTDPEVAGWVTLPDSVHAYSVTLLWGTLRKDSAIQVGAGDSGQGIDTDWSGHAVVNHGALVARSRIAFEAQDHVVQPRTDRKRLDWVSHTTDSYDGIRFWVYQRVAFGTNGSGDSLTVVAGANTWTFLVNDLASMDATYVVGQTGNMFAIQAFRVETGSCVRGFLNGIWLFSTTSSTSGLIRGRVLGNRGEVVGHIRGFFGVNRQGDNVFFAKYISASGAFRGIVRGTWTDRGTETAETGQWALGRTGSFHGEVIDGSRNPIGVVNGGWHSRPNGTDGFFNGSWSMGCTN
jgi:hypothetical protein